MPTCVRCSGLVCEVSSVYFLYLVLNAFFSRCQASKDDLDGNLSNFPRTRNFTEALVSRLGQKSLWEDFGIVSDVVVCHTAQYSTSHI
jgi:hypothetical protein